MGASPEPTLSLSTPSHRAGYLPLTTTTVPRPWQGTEGRSRENIPHGDPPLSHPRLISAPISLNTGRIRPSSITLTSRCLAPSPAPIRSNPAEPSPHKSQRQPPRRDLQSRDGRRWDPGLWPEAAEPHGQALPVATHGARRVHAPLRQLPPHGQHPAAPWDARGSLPGPSTPNYFCVSMSTELFFYCYAHKILKWMEINVRHKYGWAAWLSSLPPPAEEHGE